MATTADRGGGAKRLLPKSISGSALHKSEALKQKLQESLIQNRKLGFPHTLGSMTLYDIRLPDLREKSELVSKLLIDSNMQNDLEDVQIINFCEHVEKLYALKTAGDGNCLLHAVSLALWGIHDKAMLLRRLVYISLVEDIQTSGFNRRWERERNRLNSAVPHGMQLTSSQWSSEWDMVVKAAEDCKRSADNPGDLPFESLEEIHIFVLANVIQRPIVVLADSYVRSLQGSLLGPSNFAGIYLPLLWEPGKCSKVPIILGYHMGHFTPLVNMEHSTSPGIGQSPEYVVPLLNKDMEPLYIHFLQEAEETVAIDILQKYINVTELNWKRQDDHSDSITWLLCAKMDHTKIADEFDLMSDYIKELERKAINRKPSENSRQDISRQHSNKSEEQEPKLARPEKQTTSSETTSSEHLIGSKKSPPPKREMVKQHSKPKETISKPRTPKKKKVPTATLR